MNLPSLKFVECVDLFAHLGDGVVVLLAQASEGGLMLNVGFLEVPAELAKFGFSLLVEFDLSGRCAASFFETFAKFLKLASKVAALLLGFHTRATLSFDLEERMKQRLINALQYSTIINSILINRVLH